MINLQQIQEARERIAHMIIHTPVLDDPSGTGLRFKAEHLQVTGSFKLRGAANRVTLAAEAGARHVVTGSSGNHGQAVAYVAKQLGLKATIVVPEDVPKLKVRLIQSHGAQVEFCGTTSTQRLARAEQIVSEQGAVFIPPYDDPQIMAGQATAGLEILEQAPDVEVVYVPIGGGGLISGIASAIKQSRPGVKVVGVEPETANDTFLSRQQGRIVDIGGSGTIADGLRASHPGSLTFPVIQEAVDELVTVSDDEILAACYHLLDHVKQTVEPSGAASVAAAMRRKGERSVSLISGGNVDLEAFYGMVRK